ncbi:MAG: membrane protein insertase YidC [Gammaproteobacteria bacterium]|nr:membrane protein insertase YidC [Gammaproteobacteria bacterium]
MDFHRLFLVGALVLVLTLLYQKWLMFEAETADPQRSAQIETARGGEAVTLETTAKATDVPSAPPVVTEKANVSAPTPTLANRAPAANTRQRVEVITDLLRAELDTYGGDLRVLDLITYPEKLGAPDVPFRLLTDSGPDLYWVQNGLLGSQSDLPNHHSEYTATNKRYVLAEGKDRIEVPLHIEKDGVHYRKVYTFYRDSYYVDVRYEVQNNTNQEWRGYLYAQFVSTETSDDENTSFLGLGRLPSFTGGAIYTPDEKYKKIGFDDMREQPLVQKTTSGWVAMLQHYFVGALLAEKESQYEFYSLVNGTGATTRYSMGYKHLAPLSVAAGRRGEMTARMFVGPKENKRLVEADRQLELAVDFGWLTPVSAPLFWLLTQIQRVVVNWGLSIVLLTALVKLVFFPLSAASYKSMAKMKKLGPRMKTLKERYGDDKQKFQQAMMEMYKKDKINPLGGCLPIVVQIPVFIALYWVLLESVELRQAPLALWIHDLSAPDPYYVLPILMGASMFVQQLLNPAPVDPMQANIMRILPIVFTLFFLWFPAGLVLYWLVNNLLSIAQQWFVMRKFA